MNLNTLKPAQGAKKPAHRVGRGIGCGKGKTCGRGHKGQKARAGGFHKVGFEGGQMPIQRRLPKFGFTSRQSLSREQLRLSDLENVNAAVIDLKALKTFGIIRSDTKYVKVFASGKLNKAVTLKGIKVTAGARAVIEAEGGKIEN